MTFRTPKLAALVSFALVLVLSPVLHAQTSSGSNGMSTAERDQLKQEIVKEVIDQLRSSGMLQDAVQQGIHEFIVKQQQARMEARKKEQAEADQRAAHVRPVSVKRDHIYGNPNAEISLIEYSDFECPYCKQFHSTSKELVDKSDGEVNLVYRHFPLSFHANAEKEAEASECAAELGGNKGFWAYADAIFERTTSNGHGFPLDQLVPLAAKLGMDKGKFKDCVDSGRYASRVRSDLVEGERIGVAGTPGNILLDHKTGKALMRPGVQPLGALMEAVKTLTEADHAAKSQGEDQSESSSESAKTEGQS